MKISFILPVVSVLSCLASSVAAGVPHAALRRQDDGNSVSTTTSTTSQPSDTSNTHSTPVHTKHKPTKGTKGTKTHTEAKATSTRPAGLNITIAHPHDGDLPLQPIITPALGISGAVLLISGVAYTLIGIKSPWLYISFSTAYLSSLSITVLIIYVMSPPVSNAIQGAYFVAAFIPGCIIGGVSIIFKEVTDKLACVLGGFCLSMWFLALKEGGLITSSNGKIIFIACMTGGGASLAFSQYTRIHGLIVSISLGGATATVLGIDCFSRAGLKEFWLYLWDLNDSEFPIYTDTYPVTRGMRVELAATIIITLIGMMSQYKIWKIIKEKRAQRAALQRERDDDLDKIETAVGERVQEDNTRDMARWEADFESKDGSGTNTISGRDSMTDTMPKKSISVREVRRSLSDTIEMDEMPGTAAQSQTHLISEKPRHAAQPTPIQVHVAQDDTENFRKASSTGSHLDQPVSSPHTGLSVASRASTEVRKSTDTHHTPGRTGRNSYQNVPPPPEVVPPPFTIPREDDVRSDGGSIISTAAASMQGQRNSNRFSIPNGLKRLSASQRHSAMSDSTEALVIPHIEDDRASSVVATLDLENDRSSLPALSAPTSPQPTKISFEPNEGDLDRHGEAESGTANAKISREDPEGFPTLRINFDPEEGKSELDVVSMMDEQHRTAQKSDNASDLPEDQKPETLDVDPVPSPRNSGEIALPPPVTNLSGHLPDGLSKVAMTYRTNEWAKHLEAAEKPEFEDIQSSAPGMAIDDTAENPAPVTIEQPHRPEPSRRTSHSNNPYKQPSSSKSRSRNTLNGLNNSNDVLIQSSSAAKPSPKRSTSQLNLGGGLSNNSSSRLPSSHAVRSSSGPPGGSADEGLAVDNNRVSRAFPTPTPNSTLMGQRNSMMQLKPVSTSFNPSGGVPESTPSRSNPSATPSVTGSAGSDEIPFAQRKASIHKQQQRQSRQSYQSPAGPTRQMSWAQSNPYNTFDSHQPKRENGLDPSRRQNMLANWRESVRHEIPTTGNAGASKSRPPSQHQLSAARREQMVQEHRRETRQAQKKQAKAEQKEMARDSMMRQGDMLSAHASMMKKMQAQANKTTQPPQ